MTQNQNLTGIWETTLPEPGLNIALLMDSEVVRAGLAAVLGTLPQIASVRADPITLTGHDVLITTVEQWRVLAERAGEVPPLPPLLVLGDEAYEGYPELFVALPAAGFLSLTDLTARTLADTLRRVVDGELPMPAALARRLLTGGVAPAPRPTVRAVSLTQREQETLGLLSDGLSNKEIAGLLGISPHGAKRLVGSVLLKLGAPNRTAAVIAAMKAGLV